MYPSIEVTKDEFHSWYEGWLDFYLNSDYALPISETYSQKWAKYSNDKTAIYKEAKRLLNSMYNIFGELEKIGPIKPGAATAGELKKTFSGYKSSWA